MKFNIFLLLLIIFIIPHNIYPNTTNEIYNKTILLNDEINKNPLLLDYMSKEQLSSVEKKEVSLYLSKYKQKKSTNFYKLLTYAILLSKSENENLREYYTNRIYKLYQKNHECMLLLYINSIKYKWNNIKNIEVTLQYYRLSNNFYTYQNFSDIILSEIENSNFSDEEKLPIFNNLTDINSTNLSVKVYQFLNDILYFNIPNISNDYTYIFDIFRNDFQNFNILLINSIKFITSIIANIFIILSILIFIKKRKLVYHRFSHKLPSKAPIIYHRIFTILGTYILYSILGIYGIFILFGFLSIKFLNKKDRNLILMTSVFILINILANQFTSFLYISLPKKSSYSLYNTVYLEGYNRNLYKYIVEYKNQNDPMILSARALIEYKKGDYISSIEYWNKFSNITGKDLPEELNNKANAYYMLGDYKSAEKIYQESLDISPLAEVYYNLSKLYLVHLQMNKHNKYIEKAMNMNSYFVDKYISSNNKYLPDGRASKNIISPLKIGTIFSFIMTDAFNSKYTISSFFQFFIIFKLLLIIIFIIFILKSKMRNPRLCSICGMQICYHCVGTDSICNICNTNLEGVKSKILKNKIILELGYNSKLFEFKLYKLISILIPGSYNILFKTTTILSIIKITLITTLWTLLFFTFDTQSLHLVISEIQGRAYTLIIITLISIYAYNIFQSIRNYRHEKKSIIRPGGI